MSRGSVQRKALVAIVVAVLFAAACSSGNNDASSPAPSTTAANNATYPRDAQLRLNQIQVLGSHNSYHGALDPKVLAALTKIGATVAATLDYAHRPLAEQFPLGIRQLELDVWSDPQGGKFAQPSLPKSLGVAPPDAAVMAKPGFKVIHEADIDKNPTSLPFLLCLKAVKTWSDA